MNTSAATLSPRTNIEAKPPHEVTPLVLIDNEPRSDLWVRSITMNGLLDIRSAELVVEIGPGYAAKSRAAVEQVHRKSIVIAQPIVLAGSESRLLPLLAGHVDAAAQRLDSTRDEHVLSVGCDWQALLGQSLTDEQLEQLSDAVSTVGELVEQLNVIARLSLSTTLLKPECLAREVRLPSLREATAGRLLESVLDDQRLVIQREMLWDGHRVSERRVLRAVADGRPIRLALGALANPAGAVESLRLSMPSSRPVKYVAEADGQVVESTFDLLPGWDTADQNKDDSEYARSTSGDFDAVANVFRLWVLNEDGAFDGATFDLTSFFDEGHAIRSQALRFGQALTKDSAGRSVGTPVQYTLDSGANWFHWPGDAIVLRDRAGLYLEDDQLPTGFIDAVRSGVGGVRITATLQSPMPVRQVRWRGNPFAGTFDERRVDISDSFAWRRVAASSRFFDQVQTGERAADIVDDRAAMLSWLAQHAVQSAATGGQATVQTVGPMLGLRLGDRLDQLAGRAIDVTHGDPASHEPAATLMKIQHRWDTSQSELFWEAL